MMLCTASTKAGLRFHSSPRTHNARTRTTTVAAHANPANYSSHDRKNDVTSPGLLGVVLKVRAAMGSMAQRSLKDVDAEELNAQIKQSVKSMRMLAMVVPFAAVSGSTDTFFIITKAVASFIKLYLLLLFVRVLLSWFPTFTWWEQQPWLALRQVTDPYLKLFSGLVPPLLGTIDLTPLFGFFILQFLGGALDVADDETRFWS